MGCSPHGGKAREILSHGPSQIALRCDENEKETDPLGDRPLFLSTRAGANVVRNRREERPFEGRRWRS